VKRSEVSEVTEVKWSELRWSSCG